VAGNVDVKLTISHDGIDYSELAAAGREAGIEVEADLGASLTRGFATQLGARSEHQEPSGTTVSFVFPLLPEVGETESAVETAVAQ
jgi:two-component sensor histidine kinase